MSDERIQPALHALLLSDAGGLQSVLTDDPEMVHATWNGNTLLEWATQPPHGIGPDCIAVLIESGASLDRALGRLLQPRRSLHAASRCRGRSDVG